MYILELNQTQTADAQARRREEAMTKKWEDASSESLSRAKCQGLRQGRGVIIVAMMVIFFYLVITSTPLVGLSTYCHLGVGHLGGWSSAEGQFIVLPSTIQLTTRENWLYRQDRKQEDLGVNLRQGALQVHGVIFPAFPRAFLPFLGINSQE